MTSAGDTIPTGFYLLDDRRADDFSLPAFMVSKARGFLPRLDPIVQLPPEFAILESLLSRMPVTTLSGRPGLLAEGKLGDAVLAELPDLTDAVVGFAHNLPLMNALYRDYSFLASAYLLEPCHTRFLRGEPYGLGRQRLPRSIAVPIAKCAEVCRFKPFMEYAGSYALFNYRLADPTLGLEPSNVRLIRAFEHGLDPASSEAGFVLVHIDMVRHSGRLVAGTCACLDASASRDRLAFNTGLRAVLTAMKSVNAVMDTMWQRSKPRAYTSFRTFIFGITAQSMFPHGVVYEGVSDQPQSFRGESGANDSMVPLMDNFLQILMPETPLTEILKDFRDYRPSNHRQFLEWVRSRSLEVGAKGFALGHEERDCGDGDGDGTVTESRRLWLLVLNQVRDFRWRHWCFAKEYILKNTGHATATGGSPIVTWLPNQLGAVLEEMVALHGDITQSPGLGHLGRECQEVMDLVYRQRETLTKEVERYCAERGVGRR